MSSCQDTTGMMLASVEGMLDAEGEARLASHLEGCPSCRRALADQAAIKQLLQEVPLDQVSPGFATRVRERVAERPLLDLSDLFELINWRTWTLRLAPVAAVLALLAWLPLQSDTSASQPLAAVLDSWAVAGSDAEIEPLLTPGTDINRVLEDQFGASPEVEALPQ